MGLHDLHDAVLEGRVDAICTASYDCAELISRGYHVHPVRTVPLMVFMESSNPLASKKSLSFGDLRGEPLLVIAAKSFSGHEDHVYNLLTRHANRRQRGRPLRGSVTWLEAGGRRPR